MNSHRRPHLHTILWFGMLVLALCASCSAGNRPVLQTPVSERAVVAEWADTPVGKAVRMGAGPNGPAVLSRVNPNYPDIDLQSRRRGTVRVEVVIDETGRIIHTQVLEAPSPSLSAAATEAVRKWKFAVTSLDGRPVRVVMPVVMKFELP
jgi:TonB family protein